MSSHMNNTISELVDDPAVLQAFQDALEDVHTRFLLNLPPEELATADRILFQIEQAWWFYEDWICDQQQQQQQQAPGNNVVELPRFKHLKPFAVEMFHFSPLLPVEAFPAMWEQFSHYKRKISTHGCILLNADCNKILLCQDYNSKSWTCPAGKINQGEEGIDAATRETWEETGFDVTCKNGLTQQILAQNKNQVTWTTPLQEKDAVAYTEDGVGKRRTYYICHGVPEDFPFEPVVRKEVAAVQWHPLEKVPKKNYAILPILPKVRRWIKRNVNTTSGKNSNKTPKKGRDKSNPKQGRDKSNQKGGGRHGTPNKKQQQQQAQQQTQQNPKDPTPLKSNKTPGREKEKKDRKKQGSRPKSRGKGSGGTVQIVQHDDPLLETGLANVGANNRWTEEEMFRANERLLGRKIEYDGNPHIFSEQGFQGMDPHHFHIVGGNFLNANSNTAVLAPPPPTSRLQHLFHTKSQDAGDTVNTADNTAATGDNNLEVLTPFFSDDGATPWGEVVQEVKESVASPERHLMLTDHSLTTTTTSSKATQQQQPQKTAIMATADHDSDLVFMTDQEITAKSQKIKLAEWKNASNNNNNNNATSNREKRLEQQYQRDMRDVHNWVQSLPQPQPTKHFGEFKFNVDALMEALYAHY